MRVTGICDYCGRRVQLSVQSKLVLHSSDPRLPAEERVRCRGSITRDYKPGPDWTPSGVK